MVPRAKSFSQVGHQDRAAVVAAIRKTTVTTRAGFPPCIRSAIGAGPGVVVVMDLIFAAIRSAHQRQPMGVFPATNTLDDASIVIEQTHSRSFSQRDPGID